MAALTRKVIDQLIEEPSWTTRAKVVERIATRFADGSLTDIEWHTATDVFRIALYDGEPLVRRILAESVKQSHDLPRDLVLSLARDVAEVAAPLLAASPLLSEDDLLVIACGGSNAHRMAIARRTELSGRVADALCRSGEPAVVRCVLANNGAVVPETTLRWLLDRTDAQPGIAEAVAARRVLPVSIAGRLAARRREMGERPVFYIASERHGTGD